MQSLYIWSIVALVVAGILAIVVWSIVFIEYRKILRERRIDRLLARISERAEDSGNESDGDQEELSGLVERGHLAPWDVDDL
uniref:Protein Vpu n=11 Tax=Human immunodeficiency virus type 1 TaxID=11676 RepID=T2CJ56_HV1|nr:vpu protein [Human immunodeficiency virus 1]QIU83942.1 vpu protein [Human immunodeficiency virus 1]QIU84063.1 vpu protein [Human immunodeficiency virus 1]QIU85333.1 vpu protein [Human immunodeficiency virus 1]QIU85342.1 vpu protein [Human immunodeficiency virus 1]